MSIQWQLGLLAVLAYLVGSIPFGLIVGKTKGIDPRTAGSGNIGATNVGRLLGGKYFAIVFLCDMAKGLIPMLFGAFLLRNYSIVDKPYLAWMLIGAGAMLGHVYSIFLNFKGGKGVATSAGILLGLYPYFTYPGLCVLGLFVLIFFATRMVSVGSMIASSSFPAAYVLFGAYKKWPVFHEQLPLLIFSTLLATLILYKHRTNITRILKGEENKFGQKKN